MARKKLGVYGPETLVRVQHAWSEYQDRTGAIQAEGAKAMGMGTSGFNQYLRGPEKGGVPLNTNFLIKFAAPPVFGTLRFDERDKAWWVAQTVGGIPGHYTLQAGDFPLRVSGVHYPRTATGRTFAS